MTWLVFLCDYLRLAWRRTGSLLMASLDLKNLYASVSKDLKAFPDFVSGV